MKRCLLLPLLFLFACEDDITVENIPGKVTSVGPVELLESEDGQVGVQFTVRDLEGDDVPVLFEICDEDDRCGIATLNRAQSDPVARIPSVPKNTDVPHFVVWDANCGFYLEDPEDVFSQVAATEGETYRARLSVVDQPDSAVTSATFELNTSLDSGACEP